MKAIKLKSRHGIFASLNSKNLIFLRNFSSNLNSKKLNYRIRTWTLTCKNWLNSNKNWSSSQPWIRLRWVHHIQNPNYLGRKSYFYKTMAFVTFVQEIRVTRPRMSKLFKERFADFVPPKTRKRFLVRFDAKTVENLREDKKESKLTFFASSSGNHSNRMEWWKQAFPKRWQSNLFGGFEDVTYNKKANGPHLSCRQLLGGCETAGCKILVGDGEIWC